MPSLRPRSHTPALSSRLRRYKLRTLCEPGTVLGSEGAAVNKAFRAQRHSCLCAGLSSILPPAPILQPSSRSHTEGPVPGWGGGDGGRKARGLRPRVHGRPALTFQVNPDKDLRAAVHHEPGFGECQIPKAQHDFPNPIWMFVSSRFRYDPRPPPDGSFQTPLDLPGVRCSPLPVWPQPLQRWFLHQPCWPRLEAC